MLFRKFREAQERGYNAVVPAEVRAIAEAKGWGKCNWYDPGASAMPYYSPSAIEFLEYVEKRSSALDQEEKG